MLVIWISGKIRTSTRSVRNLDIHRIPYAHLVVETRLFDERKVDMRKMFEESCGLREANRLEPELNTNVIKVIFNDEGYSPFTIPHLASTLTP